MALVVTNCQALSGKRNINRKRTRWMSRWKFNTRRFSCTRLKVVRILKFQSHVSTRPLQVERVDSVPPVLSWLPGVLAVARPCQSAPKWIQVWHSIFPGISRNIWLGRKINKCALRQASNQVLQVHGFCVSRTTQYLSASEKFTHVL